jgi:hypothetical protein
MKVVKKENLINFLGSILLLLLFILFYTIVVKNNDGSIQVPQTYKKVG